MKLLSKTAEERYQTAAGAARDLRAAWMMGNAAIAFDEFRLANRIRQTSIDSGEIVRRESEIGALLAAFDRVVAAVGRSLFLFPATRHRQILVRQ